MDSLALKVTDYRNRLQYAEEHPDEQASSDGADHQLQYTLLRKIYHRSRAAYHELEKSLNVLSRRLKDVEKEWIQTMRRLSDRHDTVLTDCGLLRNENESEWGDSDYNYEEPAREAPLESSIATSDDCEVNHVVQVPPLNIHPAAALDVEMTQQQEESANGAEDGTHQKALELREPHHRLIQSVRQARRAHDKHRESYQSLLHQYIEDEQDGDSMDHADFATRFAPLYLQRGQECAAELQAAEEALASFEKEAYTAGNFLLTKWDHLKPEDHAVAIGDEDTLFIQRVDRDKVEQWMNEDMDAISIAATIPDKPQGEGVRT